MTRERRHKHTGLPIGSSLDWSLWAFGLAVALAAAVAGLAYKFR